VNLNDITTVELQNAWDSVGVLRTDWEIIRPAW